VLARKHQKRAANEVTLAQRQVTNVDFSSMDSSTRKAFEMTGMALQHQAAVIGRMDIRQQNLENAVEQVAAEQRLNAEQLSAVQARLAELEARVNSGAPTAPPQQVGYVQPQALPPGAQPGYAPNGWVHQPAQQPPTSGYPQQG
jgi:BMFP domain-containing protein YqiC